MSAAEASPSPVTLLVAGLPLASLVTIWTAPDCAARLAAEVMQILAELSAGFANPAFSAHEVGRKLGLTGRYVQELPQETDFSFTVRVLELRLQKARAMLADPRHDRLKVSDIALACGVNDVSHFNHSFRRRFGGSPTQFRGGLSRDV